MRNRPLRTELLVQLVFVSITTSVLVFLGSISGHSNLYGYVDQPSRSWVLEPMYRLECVNRVCYRWIEPDARLYLYALDGDHARLTLRLRAPLRHDGQPTHLTITVNERAMSPITVATDWRSYHLLLPTSAAHDTVLQLHTDTFLSDTHDQRQLGVTLISLQLTALSTPTPQRTLFLIALPLLFWAFAIACGVSSRNAFLIGLSLAALSGWAAFDRVLSGYLLPTISLESSRIVPLLALVLVPPFIHWRTGHLPGGTSSVLVILVTMLLSLRLTREVAGGLTLLLLGMLVVAHLRPLAAHYERGRTPMRPIIPELTSIRFIAALTVMLFHYQKLITVPPLFAPLIAQGSASVGLFFILSGFVMTYTYADWFHHDLVRFREYARTRIARIVPLSVLALLCATPLGLWNAHGHPLNTNLADVLDRSWIANLLLIHVYVPDVLTQSLWNGPSWSVATEAFFYLTFPLFARFVLSRVTRLQSLLTLACVCFGIEILGLVGSVMAAYWLTPNPESFGFALVLVIYKSPLLRIWEFLIGATLGALFLQTRPQPAAAAVQTVLHHASVRNMLLIMAIGGILAVAYMPIPQGAMADMSDALRWYVLYTPSFVLIIAALAWGPTWATPILTHPWLVRLGEASYALYIFHDVIRGYLSLILHADSANVASLALLTMSATILASLSIHQWVETPARRWLMGYAKPSGSSAG